MYKIVFFDLDNTLCPVGKPVAQKTAELLKKLQESSRIAVISGKPVAYLNGFARQLGMTRMIMIGENGLSYQFGSDLPPEKSGALPFPKEDSAVLEKLKTEFAFRFKNMYWCQKNEYAFTPFPFKTEYFPEMRHFLSKSTKNTGIAVYEHPDCFDVLPNSINKGKALEYICSVLNIPISQSIAVGDHTNDYPMFAKAGYSVGIAVSDREKVKINVSSIEEAIEYIINLSGEQTK